MTQAAVSYQIKLLEERVGSPLFVRQACGVALTADGARLAARSGEALEILRDAFADVRSGIGEVLTISALATFATRVLAARIGAFQISHRGIGTRIEISHRFVDLLAGEASVAIWAGAGDWPGLKADFLVESVFTPVVSPAFVREHGPFRSPSDLLAAPRINADDAAWAIWFTAAGVPTPPPPEGPRQMMFGTHILEVEAALAGRGACLLPPAFYREALDRGGAGAAVRHRGQ